VVPHREAQPEPEERGMSEEWRTIPDAPAYEVSSIGRVRSWVGPGGATGRRRLSTPRVLKQNLGPNGYYRLKTGGSSVRLVAHLVAAAFLGQRPDGMEIRHLNGVRTDNRVENLAYGTRSENQLDRLLHGTHNQGNKTHCIHGHPFNELNTYYRPTGGRRCRTCQNAASNDYKRKRAA
jgi:hypothetical protein